MVLSFFPGWVVIRSPIVGIWEMKRMESPQGNAANAEYLQSLTIVGGCPNWIKLDPFPKSLSKNNPRNKLRIDGGKSSKYMSPFLFGPAWHHFKLLLFKVRRTWRETFRVRLGNARIEKERNEKQTESIWDVNMSANICSLCASSLLSLLKRSFSKLLLVFKMEK